MYILYQDLVLCSSIEFFNEIIIGIHLRCFRFKTMKYQDILTILLMLIHRIYWEPIFGCHFTKTWYNVML